MNSSAKIFFSQNFSHLRKIGLLLSLSLMIVALVGISMRDIQLGIDFSGGYITEFSTSLPMEQSQLEQRLGLYLQGSYSLSSGEDGKLWMVRQAPDPESEQAITVIDRAAQTWQAALQQDGWFAQHQILIEMLDSDYMGSQIGSELVEQGGLALLTAFIAIIIYLTARFEWRFALGAILALVHDLLIVLGIFAWSGITFDLTVLAGLLAIVGYSLNDSIIIADRIREFLRVPANGTLHQITDRAIKDTLVRTLITSGTTLATIAAVWLLGGESLAGFSTCLFWGIAAGTLSSLTIAATVPELLGLQRESYYLENESVSNID